jgi:hypothetical protein
LGAFVDFGPGLTAPPPVHCRKAVLYFFQLEADRAELDRLCCKVFQKASDPSIVCRPIDRSLTLVFGDILWVGNPDLNAAVAEKQVLIQVPVYFEVGGVCGYGHFTPYIWVNNPLSMAGGREVFGYPKGLGNLCVPRQPESSALELTLKTWVGDLGTGGVWEPDQDQLLVKQGGHFQPPQPAVGIIDYWMRQLENDHSRDLLQDRIHGKSTEIFLKQFRSFNSSVAQQTACLEQIATAKYSVDRRVQPTLTELASIFDLTIANFDSANIVSSLGLKNLSSVPGKDKAFQGTLRGSLRVEIDSIVLDQGQVLWESRSPTLPT